MKKEIESIEATPSKRLFWSIIADYDLNRAVCELIDNALDMSIKSKKDDILTVEIDIDDIQRCITVKDNAGGVRKEDLDLLVSPGKTSNDEAMEEIIGLFGVGTKRAVFALAQDIKISTRHQNHRTYQIDLTDNWLKDESWNLPLYEVDEIEESTTIIELSKLRFLISKELIANLHEHLSATYSLFIKNIKVKILINNDPIKPKLFENWAYPPDFPPQKFTGDLKVQGDIVKVTILAGLITESSPIQGDYGVYFYCNNRLITRGMKTFDVGFAKGMAGKPHPNMSLARILIYLSGKPLLMPWNSSKSDINTYHPVFEALRNWIVETVKTYTSLSKRLEGSWDEEVFAYKTGNIAAAKIENFTAVSKTYFPPLPKARIKYSDLIIQFNKSIAKDKPWTKGLYESIIAVDGILKQKLEQKNRIALILLDSTIEIAYKEFLVNGSGTAYNDAKLLALFSNRTNVQKEVLKYKSINNILLGRINNYYWQRCKLVHERANVGISDTAIHQYKEDVERVLNILFGLKFS